MKEMTLRNEQANEQWREMNEQANKQWRDMNLKLKRLANSWKKLKFKEIDKGDLSWDEFGKKLRGQLLYVTYFTYYIFAYLLTRKNPV